MEIIKDLGKPREGGSCSNCDKSYHAKFGRRFIIEYWEEQDNGTGYPISEPMNFCNTCALKIK